jgi:hypothetical protein
MGKPRVGGRARCRVHGAPVQGITRRTGTDDERVGARAVDAALQVHEALPAPERQPLAPAAVRGERQPLQCGHGAVQRDGRRHGARVEAEGSPAFVVGVEHQAGRRVDQQEGAAIGAVLAIAQAEARSAWGVKHGVRLEARKELQGLLAAAATSVQGSRQLIRGFRKFAAEPRPIGL